MQLKCNQTIKCERALTSTWKEEAGRFQSSRPAWSTELLAGQPGLHREILSKKKKKSEPVSATIIPTDSVTKKIIREGSPLFKEEDG